MKNQKTKIKVPRKTFFRFFAISVFVSTLFALIGVSLALAADSTSYKLLAPLPGLETYNTSAGFSGYVKKILDLSIVVAAVLAVLMIVLGGFKYMGSESMGVKEEGKKQMQNAVLGLLILAASFLILNTINPELLNFNLKIEGIKTPPAPAAVQTTTVEKPAGGTGTINTPFKETTVVGNTAKDVFDQIETLRSQCPVRPNGQTNFNDAGVRIQKPNLISINGVYSLKVRCYNN